MTAKVPLSKSEFGRRVGLSPSRIGQLVRLGMPSTPEGKIEEKAGRAWIKANLDGHRRAARKGRAVEGEAGAVTRLRAEKLRQESELLALELRRKAGELLDRRSALAAIESRARHERDALIGWVNRAAPEIATVTGADLGAVVGVLDRLVRLHLADMAGSAMKDFDDVRF